MELNQSAPQRWFAKMLFGLSQQQLAILGNFDAARKAVYVWNGLTPCPRHVEVGDKICPWPVTFLLSQYNKKFIFTSGSIAEWSDFDK